MCWKKRFVGPVNTTRDPLENHHNYKKSETLFKKKKKNANANTDVGKAISKHVLSLGGSSWIKVNKSNDVQFEIRWNWFCCNVSSLFFKLLPKKFVISKNLVRKRAGKALKKEEEPKKKFHDMCQWEWFSRSFEFLEVKMPFFSL